jgi:vanillate O-demethylase monooxygenase subunit
MPVEMGELGQQIAQGQVSALAVPFTEEDLPMLEAQQLAMGDDDFWSLKPVLLPGDAAAIRARRVLDGLIAQEKEVGL